MTATWLKSFRKGRSWNQQELARRLRVSQPLVSQWENGNRSVGKKYLHALRKLGVKMDATALPMREDFDRKKVDFAAELANLGYPGFAHFSSADPEWNPAQLLLLALSQENLDRRSAEALPWLAMNFSEMDWQWVVREAKLRDLQNRLGFTLLLAKKLAGQKGVSDTKEKLRLQEENLQASLLVKEDTYCDDSMTEAERNWLKNQRSPDAAAWHMLSDLQPAYLTHA
jgi:transcriptional regulator with XRE-family HTH domain